jgi:alpha-beta hydrolase superfamily lysophospholipase
MKWPCFALAVLACAQSFAATPRVEEVEFTSHGAKLSGSIAFPDQQPIHAALVFIHGSGKQSRNMELAQRFANDGVVALVYDKRGAGKSGGEYEGQQNVSEKNIALLADDAVSALEKLATHPSLKGVPVGFAGISQAGWIVPLAAEKSTHASFLVVWSGPVTKVSEEDIFSKHTADKQSAVVPSYAEALRARKQPYIWPDFLGKDTDPADSLRNITIPGLWLFSDNDGSIPVDLSIERLKALRQTRPQYDYVLFSDLGHDNIDGSFATAVDWIKRLPAK